MLRSVFLVNIKYLLFASFHVLPENATCGFKTKLVPKNGHGRHDTLHTNGSHDLAHDDHDEHGEFYEHEYQNAMMVTVSLFLYFYVEVRQFYLKSFRICSQMEK